MKTVCVQISLLILLFSLGCALHATAPTARQDNQTARDSAEMILIQGGKYLVGSSDGDYDEQPVHEVLIDPFYIDVHEVTNQQFQMFLEATGHPKPAFWHPEIDKPDDPVVGVSWYDAVAYAVWVGKRLPTEVEWELAARGGSAGTKYPWGDDPDCRYANFKSFGIAPVKSLKPNNYGLYDLIGNVWEWCSDWYDRTYYSSSKKRNPQGPVIGTHKVLRGGAWYCREDQVRVTNRFYAMPDVSSFNFGFRCAKSADKDTVLNLYGKNADPN